jgi:hypothetical protein
MLRTLFGAVAYTTTEERTLFNEADLGGFQIGAKVLVGR